MLILLLPSPSFDESYSTVMTSSDGTLLGASVADDGQWRFPPTDSFNDKYLLCVLEYEDKWFFYHWGFNPVSFIDALRSNLKAGEVVRGGSTLSMQVVRLSRGNQPRTYLEKCLEVLLAMKLELTHSKQEIFSMYAAHAPFGGNVVGVDAAAWRYFHTTPDRLTWAEAATLAVLPNSPSLINLGRSRDKLLQKRNNLLRRLPSSKVRTTSVLRNSLPSEEDVDLAMMETIPQKPSPVPMTAYHLLKEKEKTNKGELIKTDINFHLQENINEILRQHHAKNTQNSIENAAVLVYDYLDDKVVAYIGNNLDAKDAASVNMVEESRSSGSTLKPFLFCSMLDEGTLLPEMLLPDVPFALSGYTPKNYSGSYDGAVSASRALQRSLNAPFVFLLKQYGVSRFITLLKDLGFRDLVPSEEHYGLALILGGAEVSLHELVSAYALLGHKVAEANGIKSLSTADEKNLFSAEACAVTLNILTDVVRPLDYQATAFNTTRPIAWKTGTSLGFRGAWSVGLTDRYVIGVWVGNANFEGRANLTGLNVAAPIFFDIFNVIQDSYSYPSSTNLSNEIEVCAVSGLPKGPNCPTTKTVIIPNTEIHTGVCHYHKKIYLDANRRYAITPECERVDNQRFDVYFVLPPIMEWFYKKIAPDYRPLPLFKPSCEERNAEDVMAFIYPQTNSRVIIPVGIKGDKQKVIFELAHRRPSKQVFWTLDNTFIGVTRDIHQKAIDLEKGEYSLRVVDEDGFELRRKILVK